MAAPASGSIPVLVLGGATGPARHFQFPCDIRGDGRVDVDAQALSTALGGHVGAVRLLLHQGRVIRCRKGEGTFACNPEYAILVVPSSSPSSFSLTTRGANGDLRSDEGISLRRPCLVHVGPFSAPTTRSNDGLEDFGDDWRCCCSDCCPCTSRRSSSPVGPSWRRVASTLPCTSMYARLLLELLLLVSLPHLSPARVASATSRLMPEIVGPSSCCCCYC